MERQRAGGSKARQVVEPAGEADLALGLLRKIGMQTTSDFSAVWSRLAAEGICDGPDGAEYRRVEKEWIAAGRPEIEAFVRQGATNTAPALCPRCGRSDGAHGGFHTDAELPIKKGDRVRIRAGAEIRSTCPQPARKKFLNKRARTVTVFDMDNGYGPVANPGICWVGTGGYWHYALLVDVDLVA